jgi:hypothetical protein
VPREGLEQAVGVEGLGEVLVGAALHALAAGGFVIHRGQEDDRYRGAGGGLLGLDPAADLEAVDVGEHHVEHDQPRRAAGDLGDRVGAVERPAVGEAGELGVGADQLVDHRVVLDDQHVRHAVGVRCRHARSLARSFRVRPRLPLAHAARRRSPA